MRLYLYGLGLDFRKIDGLLRQTQGVEIGNANGTHLARLHSLLNIPIARLPIVRGLMQEKQINVVSIQAAQRIVHGSFALVDRGPQLGDKIDVLAFHAAGFHGPARCFFILVGIGGIYQPNAIPERAFNGSLRFSGCKGKHADPGHGHLGSVVQLEKFHVDPPHQICFLVTNSSFPCWNHADAYVLLPS